jgi:hypothetical protein
MCGERGSPGRCGWGEGREDGEKALEQRTRPSFFLVNVAGEGFGATPGPTRLQLNCTAVADGVLVIACPCVVYKAYSLGALGW